MTPLAPLHSCEWCSQPGPRLGVCLHVLICLWLVSPTGAELLGGSRGADVVFPALRMASGSWQVL